MANKVANPRKVFNFLVEIDGIDQFEVQKITLPEVGVEQVEHGDVNYKVKTAGQVTVGNMTMEKLKRIEGSSASAMEWLRSCQSQLAGGGLLAEQYKKIVIIKEMDTTGKATLTRHICTGTWPTKISQNDLDRTGGDNIIQTIEFSVDIYEQI